MPTEESIRQALSQINYPGFSRDIVSFGLVKGVTLGPDGHITVDLAITTHDQDIPKKIETDIRTGLTALDGVHKVTVNIQVAQPPTPAAGQDAASMITTIPGVKRVIAVASGKGGVGKSTVAANLAVALAARGNRVGLCDCDLYGPSISLMFGSDERPLADEQDRIIPIMAHGVQLMSMGFLLSDNSPVVVRGPIATRYTQQFLRQVAWDDLDILVLDLPPGTGDIQLTIVQTVALDGAVIVTTPQEVALIDARKAAGMFDKVNVSILGIIENMSWFECPSDGKRYYIFGKDGGVKEARQANVPLLAQIPITEETRERADRGEPIALLDTAENATSAAFHTLAGRVVDEMNVRDDSAATT